MKSGSLGNASMMLLRAGFALACGICTGVVLVVAIVAGPTFLAELQGSKGSFSSGDWAEEAARTGLLYALMIALVASPIWLALGRVKRNTLVDAAVLGFLLTFASWCSSGIGSITAREFPLELVRQSATFGLAGAVSGIVTWLLSRRRVEG